ncbi:MAG TPA: hypothetical protein VGG35_00460 [Streptosporangiaceae bacterium]
MSRHPRWRTADHPGDVLNLLAQARPPRLDPDRGTAPPAASFLTAGPSAAPATPPPGGSAPRGRRRRYLMAGLAVTAAAALAAGLTVAVAGPPGRPASGHPGRPAAGRALSHPAGPPPGAGAPAPSARAVLLTAAVNAARVPVTGRYWRVVMTSGSAQAAGPNAHPFAVMQRWFPSANWYSRSAARQTWTLVPGSWTSQPASAGAEAAWRAAGSPPLPRRHGPQQAWWQTGGGVGYLGNGNLTFAQFRALPSAPRRLAAVVRRAARAQSPSGVRYEMFDVYDQLLKWDPITPQVRAAVFRDLAALPGVRSAGRVTDPLGRVGYGIEMTGTGSGAERQVLVIAPGTASLLADEYFTTTAPRQVPPSGARPGLTSCPGGKQPARQNICGTRKIIRHGKKYLEMIALGPRLVLPAGSLESYDAVIRAGWTNARPRLPAASLRFSTATDGRG